MGEGMKNCIETVFPNPPYDGKRFRISNEANRRKKEETRRSDKTKSMNTNLAEGVSYIG